MFKEVHDNVISALFSAYSIDEDKVDLSKITTEPSRKANSGDMATNVAMVVAKQIGMEPIKFAELYIPFLEKHYGEGSCEIAGPGFINITMEPMFWLSCLQDIMKEENNYGAMPKSKHLKTNVEYVSANPTGPLHIGHARGAILGDVLSSIYEKCGLDVTREYYVNDAGGQIDLLVKSVFAQTRKMVKHTIVVGIPDDFYSGQYIADVAWQWDNRDATDGRSLREFVIESMMELIQKDLKSLGIKHDVFTYESDIVNSGGVIGMLNILREKDLIYKGVLPPPKGKEDEDYDKRNQLLFKSTEFGDDVDRPLKKADGSWTYFATDAAYHLDKMNRGFNVLTNIWGADHGGYVSRVVSAVDALSNNRAGLEVALCQMVSLIDNGEKLKQSKRDGNFITVEEVVNRVGKDALRFTMMTRKPDAHLDFDFQKAVEETKDNMVYYVQYAHARAHSVLNKADERPEYEDVFAEVLERLTDEKEMDIVKHLAQWKDILFKAANHKEPHRIAYYLYELAGLFHSLQGVGNNDPKLRFLVEGDDQLQMARLILVQSVIHVLKSGLDVLGVSAPTSM